VSRDFLLQIFFLHESPYLTKAPENNSRIIYNFFKNSQRNSMHKSRCTTGINENVEKVATCVNDSTANLPPVSTTPVANLPPVSITPMASFATGTAGVVDTDGPRNEPESIRDAALLQFTSLCSHLTPPTIE
jgi:hypothetical protein